MTIPVEIRRENEGDGSDVDTLSARMNARLDEATAETREAWRTAVMLRNTRSKPFNITEKDIFVMVPPLYGLRDVTQAGSSNCKAPGTTSTRSTTTVAGAGVVGYSLSAQPLYHSHSHQR